MKKRNFYLLAFLLCVSCFGRGKLDKIGAPNWVFDSYSVGDKKIEVAGVGIGEKTAGGLKMQIAQAESDARANIANGIRTEITRVTKDVMEKVENISNTPGTKNPISKETIEKNFSQVTEDVVKNLPLTGARRTHIWQDPNNDTLFVRMTVERSVVEEYLKKSEKSYVDQIKGLPADQVKGITDKIGNISVGNDVSVVSE